MINPNHPILRPLWVRLLIVTALLMWSVLEFVDGNLFWAVVFLVAGGFAFNALIMRGPEA
ncbi:hypothetical protein [Paracoccus jeotgali]|uniref:DUF3329 domain-containing protein n=1 Tax=Paracoccus jeotgali TaxID=2065379 RepID=A0A2K9MBQ0_9RHOB|nr:hypothetical protein [Paracoccus jeotgali]AUM73058.1 hypothetical protein CYR75_00990 [Paracoccus jeotgali]